MCVIVGIISKNRQSVTDAAISMIGTVTSEFPLLDRVELSLRDHFYEFSSDRQQKNTPFPTSSIALGIIYSSAREPSRLAVGEASSRIAVLCGKIFNQPYGSASLLQLLGKNLDLTGDTEAAFGRLVESLDGQYSLALRWDDVFLLARDPVGVKPLYLAEDDQVVAFSSRCKPILAAGLRSYRSISAPTVVSENRIRTIRSDNVIEPIRLHEKELVGSLVSLLSQVLAKMIACERRVGILFSGGLDSSILAKLSKDLGGKCTLYCAGTSSSRDMTNARRMSSALDIELIESEITYGAVAEHLQNVVKLIESADMIRVSTSLPIFFAATESVKNGERIMLHGQGADELYGGYERYEGTLARAGYAATRAEMMADVEKLGDIIPQYDQIGNFVSVEMLSPFLDANFLRFSLGIPVQLKLHKSGLSVTRKYILRQVASRIGIPDDLLPPRKVSAQFGSGVARIMDEIARKAGYSARIAKASGFALPVQAYLSRIGQMEGLPHKSDGRP